MKLLYRRPTRLKILAGPFRGAEMFLNPANSKRKIFGLYEHVLNGWIRDKVKNKAFVLDVGANSGYDTYGFAHLLVQYEAPSATVIAFEPVVTEELETPRQWPCYQACRIEIVNKLVGRETTDSAITLDDAARGYSLEHSSGLIKVDIEGAEVDALMGAGNLLRNRAHDWLIEIHGKELIPEVAAFFVQQGRPFLIKELRPLPILGAEKRAVFTTWLVTI